MKTILATVVQSHIQRADLYVMLHLPNAHARGFVFGPEDKVTLALTERSDAEENDDAEAEKTLRAYVAAASDGVIKESIATLLRIIDRQRQPLPVAP